MPTNATGRHQVPMVSRASARSVVAVQTATHSYHPTLQLWKTVSGSESGSEKVNTNGTDTGNKRVKKQ